MAVNCCLPPATMVAVVGETVIATKTPDVTVRAAVPEMSPEVAVMVVAPVATPVASPWDPDVFETVAVPVTDDDHDTESVRLAVLRSE